MGKLPKIDKEYNITCYKHNGQFHKYWHNMYIVSSHNSYVIGVNEKTSVIEQNGKSWVTREPAVFYFSNKYWFNIVGMLKSDGIHYYCNLASPYLYEDGSIKYIDYDLDIKVKPDNTYKIVDQWEYKKYSESMNYPQEIKNIIEKNLKILENWIIEQKGPFSPGYVHYWNGVYLQRKHQKKQLINTQKLNINKKQLTKK